MFVYSKLKPHQSNDKNLEKDRKVTQLFQRSKADLANSVN